MFLGLIQKVITGAVVYGAVLLLLKEKLSWMIVEKFLKR